MNAIGFAVLVALLLVFRKPLSLALKLVYGMAIHTEAMPPQRVPCATNGCAEALPPEEDKGGPCELPQPDDVTLDENVSYRRRRLTFVADDE